MHTGACQNLNILMVSNSSTGTQILLTSTASNSTPSASVNTSSHYLPPECGDSNHCNILHFETNGFSYYIIPSIHGFLTLSHRADHTDAVHTTFMNVAEEYNPTQAFYDGHNHIVIACVDLQIRPRGIIFYFFIEQLSANITDQKSAAVAVRVSYSALDKEGSSGDWYGSPTQRKIAN